FSSRRRHTRSKRDWSSDVCSSDLGNAALQRKAIEFDRFLAQSQIFQGCASCNLHLRFHDVNTSDLFGHGVLDLHTWVHFDEHMVSAFIDQEPDGASTFVLYVPTEVP